MNKNALQNNRKLLIFELLLSCFLILMAAFFVIPKSAISINEKTGILGMADFCSFFISAEIAASGKPDKIYDLGLQESYQSALTKTKIAKVLPYNYMPHSLSFFVPLLNFTLDDAYHVFQFLNIISTFSLLILLVKSEICQKPLSLFLATFLIIMSVPWIVSKNNGQPMMITTLGLFAGYLACTKKKFWWAASVLIITTFKPQMAVIPMLYLLIVYGKNLWFSMVVIGLAVVAICSAIFGIGIWQSYFYSLLNAPYTLREFEPTHLIMVNVRAVLLVLFGEEHFARINQVSFLLFGISVVLSGFIAFTSRLKPQKTKDIGFSIAIILSCVFSPYLWMLTLVLLIIPIGYLLKYTDKISFYIIAISVFLLRWQSFNYPELNPFIWVSAQFCLLAWLGCLFINESRKLKIVYK